MLTRCLNQLAGTGGKHLILFLCWDDFYMNFLTARSSLVFTCRTHVLVRNAGMPAEMINFHCFGGQKRMIVKLFYSEAFFFLHFLVLLEEAGLTTTAALCLFAYLLKILNTTSIFFFFICGLVSDILIDIPSCLFSVMIQ